jgi:hypothetical protein
MTEADALTIAAKDAIELEAKLTMARTPQDVANLFLRFMAHRAATTGAGEMKRLVIEAFGKPTPHASLSMDLADHVITALSQGYKRCEREDTLAMATWLVGRPGVNPGVFQPFLQRLNEPSGEAAIERVQRAVLRLRDIIVEDDKRLFAVASQLDAPIVDLIRNELADSDIVMNDDEHDGETWRHRRIVARQMISFFSRWRNADDPFVTR